MEKKDETEVTGTRVWQFNSRVQVINLALRAISPGYDAPHYNPNLDETDRGMQEWARGEIKDLMAFVRGCGGGEQPKPATKGRKR